MNTSFHVIIPARLSSTRLPQKVLQLIGQTTVLERVYRQALLSGAQSVSIATDHEKIAQVALGFGAPVVMTDVAHQSGTDRIAEAVLKQRMNREAIIVNVQGDEPFISPALIRQVAALSAETNADMATLYAKITSMSNYLNPNIVKVVMNQRQQALYFSRQPIPFCRETTVDFSRVYRHIGLYAYRVDFLLEYVTWPVAELEAMEGLEQLRVLAAGYPIQMGLACEAPIQDINTLEDLMLAREWVKE